jgi:hypothetical protein
VISFIVPTTGRASLADTLDSIQPYDDDEIIVIGRPCDLPCDPQPSALHTASTRLTTSSFRQTFLHRRLRKVRFIECDPFHDFGATERSIGIAAARGSHLAFMDDDDVYAPGARALMADAIARTPDRPVLFRMRYPSGFVLWQQPVLRMGNVSTQMMLLPNDPAKLGRWQSGRRECDYDFLASMTWPAESIVWRTEKIADLSDHDDPFKGQTVELSCA